MITPKPLSKFSPSPGSTLVQRQGVSGLGDTLQVSQGCVAYQDPNTGQYVYDANMLASGQCLPNDPGEVQAVQSWVDANSAVAGSQVLNALPANVNQDAQKSTGFCGALGVPCPTSVPAPFSMNSGLAWLLVLGIGLIVLVEVKK